MPALKLGSDSGKPQEVGEKNTAALAGAGETASNEKVHLHASSPQTPTVIRKRRLNWLAPETFLLHILRGEGQGWLALLLRWGGSWEPDRAGAGGHQAWLPMF